MRAYILSVLLALCCLPALSQQPQAKAVLDKTAETFRKAGGVQIKFEVKAYNNGRQEGASDGEIRLKGEKFVLTTPEASTWFDGKTQWSYMESSGEVNVTNPTPEELQAINPYTFLYMYQQGFAYRMGTTTQYAGKKVKEVILTSTDPQQELARIVLRVDADTYQPLFIQLEQRETKSVSEITVTSYRTEQRYTDKDFVFDRSRYPDAEIIDLR